MKTILIAGGTGLIGEKLVTYWRKQGHEVRVLSRGKSDVSKQIYHYSFENKEIDERALKGINILVNLAGAGIADKRWTKKRLKELYSSRVDSTQFLFDIAKAIDTLEHYISASGIIAYGYDNPNRLHLESDPFGKDRLSDITEKWEAAADTFSTVCAVAKIRISVVLSDKGGALIPLAKPVRTGFGTILGSGKQGIPWIHVDDLVRVFDHALIQKWDGAYHANSGNTTNEILTRGIAKVLNKRIWLPKVPRFALKLVLGEMATVVLDGLQANNSKTLETGVVFQYGNLESALTDLLK
jgi:uncharacterized protein